MNVKVGKRGIKNARIVIPSDDKRSLIGRDWLNQLNFIVGEANGNVEYSNSINHFSERQTIDQLKRKVPELFNRQRKIKGYKIKCKFWKDAVISQQKWRRIPLQLQGAVEEKSRSY